ncbi:hypothetical protein MRX96_047369 [Rhipicephalus microplus]
MSVAGSSSRWGPWQSCRPLRHFRTNRQRRDRLEPHMLRSQHVESDADGVAAVGDRKFWSRKFLAEDR